MNYEYADIEQYKRWWSHPDFKAAKDIIRGDNRTPLDMLGLAVAILGDVQRSLTIYPLEYSVGDISAIRNEVNIGFDEVVQAHKRVVERNMRRGETKLE